MFVDMFGKTRLKLGLYTHTTRSNGDSSPEELARIYADAGYDAIAITDRWVFNGEGEINGLRILSGCEYTFGATTSENGIFRVVGLCMTSDPEIPEDWQSLTRTSPQKAAEAVRMIKQRNGIAVLEHYREDNGLPEHSPRPLELDALEVYDAPSEWCAMGRAYPGLVADMLATTHSSSLLLAANAHVGNFPGAVMVEATDFDSQSIARAVRAGRFYATQGPEIHIRQVSDEKIKVYCSPSERIAFLSNTERTGGREFCGHGLIEAECLVDREDIFIRAEVTDADGRKAFSNMIVLK